MLNDGVPCDEGKERAVLAYYFHSLLFHSSGKCLAQAGFLNDIR